MQAVLGIDIGGTNTKLGAVTFQGEILCKSGFATANHIDEESFLQELKGKIDFMLGEIDSAEVVGIGIGAPMANYHTGCVKGPVNLSWKQEVNLKAFLEGIFGLPTIVTNDANLAALSEKRYGQAKDLSSFISITAGTGLGSGIFLNNQLLHGKNDLVGELGHTTVKKNGRSCACGKRGCLETYVSANGIRRTFFKLLAEHDIPSSIRKIAYDNVTPELIYKAATEGDELARMAFDYTGDVLGMKIADTIISFEPEAVFLSGGLANAGGLLLKPTKEAVHKYLLKDYPDVLITTSDLKPEEISILGAGALAWDHVYSEKNQRKVKTI